MTPAERRFDLISRLVDDAVAERDTHWLRCEEVALRQHAKDMKAVVAEERRALRKSLKAKMGCRCYEDTLAALDAREKAGEEK